MFLLYMHLSQLVRFSLFRQEVHAAGNEGLLFQIPQKKLHVYFAHQSIHRFKDHNYDDNVCQQF